MSVRESTLPGVGKKFEIDLPTDDQLIIVVHNTGKREVFLRTQTDVDSEKLFELPDRLARTVGSVLEGAYFQPVETERVETMLSEETFLEWYDVADDAEIVGQTLAGANIRERTGVSVIAIDREGTIIPSPDPETTIKAGDTLIVIGSEEHVHQFEPLISGDERDRSA